MIIGVPKEIKKDEYRVALLPVGADLLTKDGHTVLLEREAGLSSGFDDQAYASVGAEIVESAEEIYRRSELVVKVKEPQASEVERLAQRTDAVLLFPLRGLATTDGRLPQGGHHRRCL